MGPEYGSSWVEPVLSKDLMFLAQGHNAVALVRLEPTALRSRVKHSTTKPLLSLLGAQWLSGRVLYLILRDCRFQAS